MYVDEVPAGNCLFFWVCCSAGLISKDKLIYLISFFKWYAGIIDETLLDPRMLRNQKQIRRINCHLKCLIFPFFFHLP